MRLLLTFIIFIWGGFYTFGKENCCEQCCEYLRNCCKKGKGEVKNENNVEEKKEGEEDGVQEEFYLKKTEEANFEEIKKLVNTDWYNNKGEEASFILYEKINGEENQNINENDVIKVKKDKNGFSIDGNFIPENDNNAQKWALFEIIYKEKKEEEGKTVYLYCSDIESSNFFGIFYSCKQHISISVIACDTSGVTDMSFMFSGCFSLQELDLSNFNIGDVKSISNMFSGCEALTKIIFGDKFNTGNVKNMSGMFSTCAFLQELDLSKFNTDNVTDMSGMFYNCSSLTKLDLSKFDTKNVTNMSGMFYNCSSLTELDLSNFNTKNVTDMKYMFTNCNSLQTVTINEILSEGIKQLLNELDFTEKVKEEGNVITLGKKTINLVSQ